MPRILPIVAIVIGSLLAPAAVIAQTAPTAPRSPDSLKTIGVPARQQFNVAGIQRVVSC
jgi:hypothetical protein